VAFAVKSTLATAVLLITFCDNSFRSSIAVVTLVENSQSLIAPVGYNELSSGYDKVTSLPVTRPPPDMLVKLKLPLPSVVKT